MTDIMARKRRHPLAWDCGTPEILEQNYNGMAEDLDYTWGEIERLREALRAAGINLITASNTIERLGDLQDAEATRRMAKQILPLVNEQKTEPQQTANDPTLHELYDVWKGR